MCILAINTAFSKTYVALKSNNAVSFKTMDSSLKQSENVLGLVSECLDQTNTSVDDLKQIACVIGPGSFTGIRIGASLCKGFCVGKKIKRVPINSLDLLAYTFSKTNPNNSFWVVLNALSGNLFACKYSSKGKRETEYLLAFGDQIKDIQGIIVGLKEESLELCNNFVDFSSEDLLEFATIVHNAEPKSLDFNPLYLRKSQAEAELDKKDGNN